MAETATKMPVKSRENGPGQGERPLTHLRQEIDRLFDDFHWGSWRRPLARSLFDVEPFWRGETGGVACLPSTSPRRRRNTR